MIHEKEKKMYYDREAIVGQAVKEPKVIIGYNNFLFYIPNPIHLFVNHYFVNFLPSTYSLVSVRKKLLTQTLFDLINVLCECEN